MCLVGGDEVVRLKSAHRGYCNSGDVFGSCSIERSGTAHRIGIRCVEARCCTKAMKHLHEEHQVSDTSKTHEQDGSAHVLGCMIHDTHCSVTEPLPASSDSAERTSAVHAPAFLPLHDCPQGPLPRLQQVVRRLASVHLDEQQG